MSNSITDTTNIQSVIESPNSETKSRLYQNLMKSHKLLGVSTGLIIFIICFTGVISLFSNEISVWENVQIATLNTAIDESAEQWPINKMMSKAVQEFGGESGTDVEIFYMGKSFPEQKYLSSWTHTESDEAWHYSYWNGSTGELITHQENGISEVISVLHMELWLPAPYGSYVVGFFGLILMIMSAGGIIIHRNWRREAMTLRLDSPKRYKWSDLHKTAGLWALPFHFIIGLTGALLGLLGVILILAALAAYGGDRDAAVAELFGQDPVISHKPMTSPDQVPFVTKAKEDMHPGFTPRTLMMVYPGDENMFTLIYGSYPNSLAMDSFAKYKMSNSKPIKFVDYDHGPSALQAYGISVPLHYATFGGVAMKLLYAVLGTITALLPATGIILWLRKKKKLSFKHRLVFWGLLAIPVASSWGFLAAVSSKWIGAVGGFDFSTTALDVAMSAFVAGVLFTALICFRSNDLLKSLRLLLLTISALLALVASVDILLHISQSSSYIDQKVWGTDIGLLLGALLSYKLTPKLASTSDVANTVIDDRGAAIKS